MDDNNNTPPGLFQRHAGSFAENITVPRPGEFSPGIRVAARYLVRPLAKLLHRARLEGLEKLPTEGPYLLVANHSAGMGMEEIGCFFSEWLTRRPDHPIAGFALPMGFKLPPVSWILRRAGAIPSTYDHAHTTLAKGIPILVFPGGDHETLRPVWQANRVDFGGRRGFLRIARDAGVPVVPMGIRGAHYTAPILWRSEKLASLLVLPRLFGLKRWGLSVLSLVGAAAILLLVPLGPLGKIGLTWFWLASPFVFLPWVPWGVRMRIGEPIPAASLFPEDDASLEDALHRVEAAVESLINDRGGKPCTGRG